MVPFKLTNKVSADKGSSQISTQTVPRTMSFMESQNSTRIVSPTLLPNQQRSISGASTALPSPQERKNAGKYVWNRVKLKDSPFPRYRHSAASIATNDNRIFLTGGLHDQTVYGDVWQITANVDGTSFTSKIIQIDQKTPPPRVGHASTICGNAYVVFGGDTHKLNKDMLLDDDLYLFNINSYKWTIPRTVGARPLGRYGHKISIIAKNPMETKLYLFGGQVDETYFNDLTMLDLSSFRRPNSHWEFLKPAGTMPPPLTNHTMVEYDNRLWVFGGETPLTLSNETYCYDPAQNCWSKIETTGEKPSPVQEHASAVYKHLMCVFGGKDIHNTYSNEVYFLDLILFKWYKLRHIKEGIPQERSGHSLTLMKNEKLLIMGGDKFDYANSNAHNLRTSATDQGEGTLLYTLDLSHLNELCPGIMGESLPAQWDTSNFPAGECSASNPVGNENQEAINILTPRLPNTNVTSPSDINEANKNGLNVLNDQVVTNQPGMEEGRSRFPKIGMVTSAKNFSVINKRPETAIKSTEDTLPSLKGLAIDTEDNVPASFINTSCVKVIPKSIYDDLSLEIQTLHVETQQKELETARHISELQKEVQRLRLIKEASKDSNFQMARFKNLEIQKSFLKSRIDDLQRSLDLKISQVKEANDHIAIQNASAKICVENIDTKREITWLERKCHDLKCQNEKLEQKMQNDNVEFLTRMKDSSFSLHELFNVKPTGFQFPLNERNIKMQGDEPLKKIDKVIDELHETACIKDKLQLEAGKLNDEKIGLHANLLANNNKLEALRKIFDGSSKSMVLTKKAIDLSRSELEKYRRRTDILQQQIDKIKIEQANKQEQHSTATNSNSETLHRMKVNNLKAELYISKENRDTLKEEVLALKKRLYTFQTQQSHQHAASSIQEHTHKYK